MSERAIAAEGKAILVEGTCLGLVCIKLELEVGSDVTNSTSLVFDLAVGEGDGEDTVELTL